jgi:hypothetical protein
MLNMLCLESSTSISVYLCLYLCLSYCFENWERWESSTISNFEVIFTSAAVVRQWTLWSFRGQLRAPEGGSLQRWPLGSIVNAGFRWGYHGIHTYTWLEKVGSNSWSIFMWDSFRARCEFFTCREPIRWNWESTKDSLSTQEIRKSFVLRIESIKSMPGNHWSFWYL